jgi:hypothetical protein
MYKRILVPLEHSEYDAAISTSAGWRRSPEHRLS